MGSSASNNDFIVGGPLGGPSGPVSLITGEPANNGGGGGAYSYQRQQQQQQPHQRQSLLPTFQHRRQQQQQQPRPARRVTPNSLTGQDYERPNITAIDGISVAVLTRPIESTADIETRYQYADQARRLYEYQNKQPPLQLARFWLQTRLGLLGFIVATILLLCAIQAVMWAFVTWVVPESFKDDTRIRYVMVGLEIAIGFLYITWFVGVDRGFVAPHTRYARLNARLLTLEDHTYNTVLGHRARPDASSDLRMAALDCMHTFTVLYVYAYRMFTEIDTNIRLYEQVPVDSRVSRALAEILHQRTHPHAVFRGALSVYETMISRLENDRKTHGQRDNTRVVDEAVRGVRSELEDMDTAARVRTPWLLRNHLILILGTYFIVLSPLQTAIRFDLAALVVYPVTTYLLAGNYVYQQFLGDPFTSMPEFTGMDPLQWRAERLAESHLRYNDWLRLSTSTPSSAPPSAESSRALQQRRHQQLYHHAPPASWLPGTAPAVTHSVEEMHRAGTTLGYNSFDGGGGDGGGGGHSSTASLYQ